MPSQKEKEPVKGQEIQEEKIRELERAEVGDEFEREVEVESEVEKIEKTRKKRRKKKKGKKDKGVVEEKKQQQPVPVPVSEEEIEMGEGMGVFESLRWLVLQVVRQIKIAKRQGRKIVFGRGEK